MNRMIWTFFFRNIDIETRKQRRDTALNCETFIFLIIEEIEPLITLRNVAKTSYCILDGY